MHTVLYLTKQEILSLAFDTHDTARDFITTRNPELFEKYIRLYVPVHEGWEKILNGGWGECVRNSLMAVGDKVIINFDTTVHIHLCEIDDHESMVLTLNPCVRDSSARVIATVDIINTPKYTGHAITHYAKLFEFPMQFKDGADVLLETEWDKSHTPIELNVYAPTFKTC